MRSKQRHETTRVFGFALRERDWPLAGVLAATAGRGLTMTAGLRWELETSLPDDGPPITLGSLRALGHLLRALARLEPSRG